MKINFKRLEVEVDFEGTKRVFDTTNIVANAMKYTGGTLLDIGFEDLAKEIYYSDSEVEIPEKYAPYIVDVVKNLNIIAAVKREIIRLLTNKN